MPQISTQQHFTGLRRLRFCYVCGQAFEPEETQNRDHVPAKACFAAADRQPALIMPTHVECNHGHNMIDEQLGQLIALKRGEVPRPEKRRLKLRAGFGEDGRLIGGVSGVDIPGVITRWINGFHAALYGAPLPKEARFAVETPFPPGRLADGKITFPPLRAQHHQLVAVLKRQRAGSNADSIEGNNGKLRYCCVWDQDDDGRWLCIFGLDLHGWADLGDTRNFERRGCAGFYHLPDWSVPEGATKAVAFRLEVPNRDPLDPFAE